VDVREAHGLLAHWRTIDGRRSRRAPSKSLPATASEAQKLRSARLVLASDGQRRPPTLLADGSKLCAFPRFSPLTSTSPGRPLSKDSGVGDQSPASGRPSPRTWTTPVPSLTLANDDQLVGSLSGMLKLVPRIAPSASRPGGAQAHAYQGGLHDVQVEMWGPDHAQW